MIGIGSIVFSAAAAGFGFYAASMIGEHRLKMREIALSETFKESSDNLMECYESEIEKLKYKVDSQFMIIEERKAQIAKMKNPDCKPKMPKRYKALQQQRKEQAAAKKAGK